MSSNIVFHDRSFNSASTAASPSLQRMIDVPLGDDDTVKLVPPKKQKKGCCKSCCAPVRGLVCCICCTVFLEFTIPVLFAWLCLDAATGGSELKDEEEEEEAATSGKLQLKKKKVDEEENIPNYSKQLPSEDRVREMLGLSDKRVLRSATK